MGRTGNTDSIARLIARELRHGNKLKGPAMTTPDPEQIARGLTHQIGGTDFSVTFGAHHPWDYLLRYKGEPIAGISSDFFVAVRNIMKDQPNA